ncbi:putative serine/threonine-protein kinase [Hibiscus syriacus]|uniref:Serine/threonine-protein kinase n=1 Tax=Hibiscus syriacus TaxID=106335 RepID=A0A6A2Y138_HIBSY|nr:uncharacterized protein LOC120169934 [Hibiscus syriacus]XP_039033930.1 uncharacterized protein LOC120169934 [Hibiscus syriacus]KAE8673855.1 putative serine/threonine-protein kinase [Hibiscus syriacus]
MWKFVSKAFTRASRSKPGSLKQSKVYSECSDDDLSLNNHGEERLECPICWEFFNVVENIPYVLWCGHTLCKNCVLGLQRAALKYPTLPIHLPFFVACPWCNQFCLRVVYKGNIKFPSKNYFLLWMVESMNGDRSKLNSPIHRCHPPACTINRTSEGGNQRRCINTRRASCAIHRSENSTSNLNQIRLVTSYFSAGRLQSLLRKSLVFLLHLTVKFPLIVIFLLMVLYAIPASAAIFSLYILITGLFAVPSFLILYFAFPSLDWLVREIFS